MKTGRLFSRQPASRIVLFGSKGKASENKPADADTGQKMNVDVDQQKIIDLSELSFRYAEQHDANKIRNEWNAPRIYAEKQKNLRFLSL
jgi:hypothetical protein